MRIECKNCHHTLRDDDAGLFHHSGPRANDCACSCNAMPLESIEHRVLGDRKSSVTDSVIQSPITDVIEEVKTVDVVVPPADTDFEQLVLDDTLPPAPMVETVDDDLYTLTNSELRTFKRCRRKWWLSYYRRLRLQERAVTGPAPLGTRVHEALSAYYSTDARDPIEVITESIERDMQDHPLQAEDIDKEGDLAVTMVEGYMQWVEDEGMDEGLRVIADETVLDAILALPAGRSVRLRGKIDVRVQREVDGARFFIDHKTVGSLSEPARTLHMDEQMLHYHLLERLAPDTDGYAAGGMYNMLRKVKRTVRATPPFYDRIEVHHNEHELRNYWTRVQGEAVDILSVHDELENGASHQLIAYPNPRRDCTWDCEFFAVCPMFDDGSHAEAMIEQYFQIGVKNDYYSTSQMQEGATDGA